MSSSDTRSSNTNSNAAGPRVAPLSVAERRELQRRFEKAWQTLQPSPAFSLEAHQELTTCVIADPACALYADALLLNLRKPDHSSRRGFWLGRWTRQSQVVAAALRGDWRTVFERGPVALGEAPRNVPVLLALVDAHHASGHRETAWRYCEETLLIDELNPDVRRRSALVRMTRGHFHAARDDWEFVLAKGVSDPLARRYVELLPETPRDGATAPLPAADAPCDEQLRRLDELLAARHWQAAETTWKAALARHGARLELREFGDRLALARHEEQLAVARRLAEADAAHATDARATERLSLWRDLAEELADSQLRLEVEILGGRCRLYPDDPALHGRLAECLEQQRNWPEAARCWEVAATSSSPAEAAAAWGRLAQTWQRLRQYGPSLAAYRKCLEHRGSAPAEWQVRQQALAQAARLARALGRIEEAEKYEREVSAGEERR